MHAPAEQHIPLHVVPRQLQPSSGFPEQLTQFEEQWLTQTPLSHVGEEKHVEHFVPHPPQFPTSVIVFTHTPLHGISPCGQTQVPPTHVAFVGQDWPHAPQLCASVCLLTHAPPHMSGVAVGQTHWLLVQVVLLGQTWPHAPQLFTSEVSSTHEPLQLVVPAGHSVTH